MRLPAGGINDLSVLEAVFFFGSQLSVDAQFELQSRSGTNVHL